MVIRVQMIRSDTHHPDRRRRHQGRASCQVAGRRFETEGPAPIYKLTTLLWLHGHGGADFEVWDDVSPFGKPGGLAMRGKVRNWARLVKGKLGFNRQAQSEEDFTPEERTAIAQAAGTVTALMESAPPGVANARTARSHPSDGPEHLQGQDRAPAAFATAPRPEAA